MEQVGTIAQCVVAYVAFMGMLLFITGVGNGYAAPLTGGADQPVAATNLGATMEPIASGVESDANDVSHGERLKAFILEKVKHVLEEQINGRYQVTAHINTQGEEQ